jgi:hypothetical protein
VPFNPESARPFYFLSESEIRLDQFAGWAFGEKWVNAFTYDSVRGITVDSLGAMLFEAMGPDAPRTPQFDFIAKANRESLKLGPALVSLLSKDIWILTGLNSNPTPIQEWGPGAGGDRFLKGRTATNLGTLNGGARGDVLVGHFVPLVEEMDGPHTTAKTIS